MYKIYASEVYDLNLISFLRGNNSFNKGQGVIRTKISNTIGDKGSSMQESILQSSSKSKGKVNLLHWRLFKSARRCQLHSRKRA